MRKKNGTYLNNATILQCSRSPPNTAIKMISMLSFLVLSCYLNFASAVPPQIHSAPIGTLSAINGSISGLGVPQTLRCDSRYGENLDILDCRNALSQLKTGSERVLVEDRDHMTPGDEATLPLPYRLMGSKSASACAPTFVYSCYQMTHIRP